MGNRLIILGACLCIVGCSPESEKLTQQDRDNLVAVGAALPMESLIAIRDKLAVKARRDITKFHSELLDETTHYVRAGLMTVITAAGCPESADVVTGGLQDRDSSVSFSASVGLEEYYKQLSDKASREKFLDSVADSLENAESKQAADYFGSRLLLANSRQQDEKAFFAVLKRRPLDRSTAKLALEGLRKLGALTSIQEYKKILLERRDRVDSQLRDLEILLNAPAQTK